MEHYPLTNFHFLVQFLLPKNKIEEIHFQSISGLKAEMEYDAFMEGGENRLTHHLPTRITFTDLVLKRGLFPPDQSPITSWIQRCFGTGEVIPVNMVIMLLDDQHVPKVTWRILNAKPISWAFGELNAMDSAILMEELVLRYDRFDLIPT